PPTLFDGVAPPDGGTENGLSISKWRGADGCSHPGIERIVQAATAVSSHVRLIIGGLHLVTSSDREIADAMTAQHERFKVDYVASSHCTGEPAFAAFRK